MARLDGGRVAARGFQYQYLRTVEALLAHADGSQVVACRVEGPTDAVSLDSVDSVDFDLVDAAGSSLMAVQVKSAGVGRTVAAREAVRVLVRLITGCDARRYQLITSAVPDRSALRLAELLCQKGDAPGSLRDGMEELLARSPGAWALCQALSDVQWQRLGRARIEFDGRDDAQLREDLGLRLRQRREQAGHGLSQRSGSLVLGHLVSEVLHRAADPSQAQWTVADFLQCVLVDDDELIAAVGRQDTGIVYGTVPMFPQVHRPELLAQITEAFTAGQGAPGAMPVCVLSGLSGIGKSALAAGYIAQFAFRYDAVFWIEAGSQESLAASFRRLLSHLSGAGEPVDDSDPVLLREKAHALLQALPGPWLMVFDDGVPAAALSWMPLRGRGHVLVTSLTGNWRGAGAVVEVSPMSVEDGVALLEARLRLPAAHGAGPALTALVQALECWPLAIVIAGGYLTSCRIDVSRLPAYTRTILARALDDPEAVPAGYPHTLVAAIRVSLERLRASADARGLLVPTANALAALCWMAPHRIPVHLALACAFIPADEIPLPRGRALLDEADSPVREIIRELAGVSFIQHAEALPARAELFPGSEDTVTMNAVLQSVLARELDMTAVAPATLPQAAAHTDIWLVQALRTGQAERSWLLAQHAAVLVGHLTAAGLAHNAAAILMGNLAAFHYSHGQYEQARGLLEQELACLSGCENPDEGLAAQARIILAHLDQMRDLPDACDRIASHLADVLPYLTKLADRNPDMAAVLATESLLILQTSTKTHTLTGPETAQAPGAAPAGRGWYGLLDAFTALVGTLPATAESREMTGVFGISRLLSQGHPEQAERAAADALAAVTHTWTATAAELRRLLLEALVAQDKWEQAEAELERFLPFAGPRSLYRFSVQRLVHNAGTACALRFVLTGSEQAAHLLGRLLDDTSSDHLTTAANAPEHAQILLLHTVHALWQVFASEEAARISSPAHLKFSNLLRRLTDKTFTDPHDPDSVWERIYDGLASRMTAMVTDVHHRQVQATVDAGLGDNAELLQHNARFTELLNSGRARGRLALSTDALLAATPIGTNADLLAKDRRFFPGPTPVVLLEPARMLGITLLETGEPFEMQIHRICTHGFRRMLGAHTSVPAVADLHLHLDNSTLRLRGPQEVLLARAPVAATREWHSAARARGRALVLYGFAFDLHLLPHQGALSSPHAFALRLAQAANAGLVAAALVPVTTSNPPPPRRKPHRARKASSKARQRR